MAENITVYQPSTILNHTPTTAQPWWRGSSFPYSQYKDLMPDDQFEKLIAMHENSAANAAMYVAIVLAVYIVLLSLLLCRYVKRRPPSSMTRELPPFSPPQTTTSGAGLEQLPGLRSSPTIWVRMVNCVAKPYDAIRHCTLRSGAGVASISSVEDGDGDEERCSTILPSSHSGNHRRHSHDRHNRRSSSIMMNQIQTTPHATVMDRKGSSVTVNLSMDQDEVA